MRKVNFRPLFFGLIAFCLAMVMSRYIFEMKISKIVFVAICILAVIILFVYHKCYYRLVVLVIAFVLGFSYYYFSFTSFSVNKYEQTVEICARVQNVTEYSSYSSLVLDNVKVNGTKQNFKISATSSIPYEMGKFITFNATLKNVELFDGDSFNSFYYKNGTQYKTTIWGEVEQSDGYLKLNEKFLKKFDNVLNNNFSKETAGLVKTIFVGDKSMLDEEIKNTFLNVGIAHLLAISGLHISIIVAILSLILDKLKAKRVVKLVVMFVLLLLYCYVCNFSPSVVRASLMSLMFLFSGVMGEKYDKVNAMSFSAILILIVKPLYIFDAGFLLTYFCVFSIFTLYKPFVKLLKKLKIKKLLSALAIVMSVQIGILPISLMFYKSINILSLLVNLFMVPIFEFVFVLSFAIVLICLILPFLSFLLKVTETAIVGFVYLAKAFGKVTFLTFETTNISQFLILPIYSSIFVCFLHK